MKKNLLYLLAFVFLAFLVTFIFYTINISLSNDLKQEKQVVIETGSSLKQIAEKLKVESIIESKNLFLFYVKKESKESKLQAGNYIFSPSLNIKEVVSILVEGKVNKDEVRVQILEGWTNKDISNYLVNGLKLFTEKEWQEALQSYDISEFDFLSLEIKSHNFEGYLFPDTYLINTLPKAQPEELIRKMLINFNKKLTTKMKDDIIKQGKSLEEIIIMASLVEKEAVISSQYLEDAKTISGIFWQRIDNGQALQSCASLAYILGEYKPVYSTEDTKINSPYNTYLNKGLPPSPVSNPGILAIEAAISPIESDYNYFLSPLGSDETIFSKTYQEHLQNKYKYID